MSCQICKRGACARWMHSLEEQERFDERETMSDDVDELRRTVQGLRDDIRVLANESADKFIGSGYGYSNVVEDFRTGFWAHCGSPSKETCLRVLIA